jgi:catechol 2,3-dioxygenase
MSTNTLVAEVVDDNGTRIVCPTLSHTGNATPRQEEMLRWYRNVLGQQATLEANPPATPQRSVWTSNDETHHRMGFFAYPGLEDRVNRKSPGVNHTAWEYPSIDDLLDTWERLQALGITPEFTVDHGITFAFYYYDPDGNLVELMTDAFGDHAKSMEFQLTSQELRANPPGTPVDPARLIEARRGGMELEELHRRAYAGEFTPEGGRKLPRDHITPSDQ